MAVSVVVAVLMLCVGATGHGIVMDPPQRSSMWRFGYNTPTNYDDNGLFCGGFSKQWTQNGGKCGICGDAYDVPAPRPNEAGGTYAKGIIVRTYQQGQVIDVKIDMTANHKGYFVFKICPNNNVNVEATQQCLDDHILHFVGTSGQDLGIFFYIDNTVGIKYVKLQLPSLMACSQCVLQWTYNTGNSWGCSFDNPSNCCVGCGPQENFVNCIDIAINAGTNTSGAVTTTAALLTTTTPNIIATQPATTTTPAPVASGVCQAVDSYKAVAGMDSWCVLNCGLGYCPSTHCTCSAGTAAPQTTTTTTSTITTPAPTAASVCHAVDPYKTVAGMDTWCILNCGLGYCPSTHCACS